MRTISLLCFLLATLIASADEEDDLILSTPEQIAALRSESTYLIGGVVSPLGGQIALRETDLIIKGAQEIVLSRVYIPPYIPCHFPHRQHDKKIKIDPKEYEKQALYNYAHKNYKGWQFFPHLGLSIQSHPSRYSLRLSDSNGMTLDFLLSGSPDGTTSLVDPPYAISNVVGDVPSGKYDPRNTRLWIEGNKVRVFSPEGTTRSYFRSKVGAMFLLEKEILPNGKILKYHYTARGCLERVESLDPQERYVYATLHVTGSPQEKHVHFISSSGVTVDYGYQKIPFSWKWKEDGKKRGVHPLSPPLLTFVGSPFYRHECLEYCSNLLLCNRYGKDQIFNVGNFGFGEGIPHYKVGKVQMPVGLEDVFAPICDISYVPPVAGHRGGSTTVKNSDGTSTLYHFSQDLLTTSIHYFGQDGSIKKEKLFFWNERNWLASLEVKDEYGHTLFKKSYEYDSFGNPIVETFTGDLSGEGYPETVTIRRVFSNEGRHLLLREEMEEGKVVCWSYLPNTNLITSKLTKKGDEILLREFFVYDDCHQLIREISDDGSGESLDDLSSMTQRTQKRYTLRQSSPFLHMPEWIEETSLKSGGEKLLKKTHLSYDAHGNISEEEVYDAEGNYAYNLYKIYNEAGNLLAETNSLGQTATHSYNARGHLETSRNFSERLSTTYHYDANARLKQKIEQAVEGVQHTTSWDYDFYNRKIQKQDPFDNVTHYVYNPLVNTVIKTDFPPLASDEGQPIPVTTYCTYDTLGRALTQTDATGNVTTYQYNIYGSPTEILYPDGGKELFRYTKNGKLHTHTQLDGLAIHYTYDVLGRTLSKTYTSPEGKALAEETFAYNGFHLLQETDKEGNLRQHFYDGAGRKIREEFCGKSSEVIYDSLGRVATVCKNNTLFIHYTRDLEGQLLEERHADSSEQTLFKVSYTYDADGNQTSITHYRNGKEAKEIFSYDSFGRHTKKEDPEGHSTKTFYDENCKNTLGQRVLQTTTIDPLLLTRETHDAFAKPVKKETIKDGLIARQEMSYDPHGNLSFRKDLVFENKQLQGTQITQYTYTPCHQIESCTRAFGTQEARTTAYTYFPSGKMATKTPPGGATLSYSYDPLGSLSRLDSSDGSIHHAFTHDRLGHLLEAVDENQNSAIERQVDPSGNVLQESFSNGIEVTKTYDPFNRLITLKMGSLGEVHYSYDPLFLRHVTRLSSNGEFLYQHTYEEYDKGGNLVSEALIGDLGPVIHRINLKEQKISLSSPYFTEECQYDPVGNLTDRTDDGINHHYTYDPLSQLSSENNLTYAHNSLHNRTQKDDTHYATNDLNERINTPYDRNGNQLLLDTPSTSFQLTYDPLNRLIAATSIDQKIAYLYDPLGRRLSKTLYAKTNHGWQETTQEHYLYHGQHEIGALSPRGKLNNLRVLGLGKQKGCPATVGIELGSKVFAPLLDVQGNVRRLVEIKDGKTTHSYDFTAFGEPLQSAVLADFFNPWQFASKRFDPELGLIYFGRRYYDPRLGRWLTTDPAGFVDSTNLYQYVFNNPFRYTDPDGQFVIAIPLVALTVKTLVVALAAAYLAHELEKQDRHSHSSFARNFNAVAHQIVQNIGGVSQYGLNKALDAKKKKEQNTNPFDGPVDDQVFIGDAKGNIIPVPEGHQLGGSKDGKCIQEKDKDGEATGLRKDGKGHPPSPVHQDPRSQNPHAHVPGITNPDGTPWLPIY